MSEGKVEAQAERAVVVKVGAMRAEKKGQRAAEGRMAVNDREEHWPLLPSPQPPLPAPPTSPSPSPLPVPASAVLSSTANLNRQWRLKGR